MLALTLAALLQAPPAAPVPPPVADTITIVARRGKCRVELAGRMLTDREFDARAGYWAQGNAVRVIEPRGADRRCLVRISRALFARGARLIQFVDPPAADPSGSARRE